MNVSPKMWVLFSVDIYAIMKKLRTTDPASAGANMSFGSRSVSMSELTALRS